MREKKAKRGVGGGEKCVEKRKVQRKVKVRGAKSGQVRPCPRCDQVSVSPRARPCASQAMGREEDLEALDEEVNSLEVHIQEVEAGKRAIESLDAEAAEAAEAAQRVAERVSAEERKKAQLEQRGAGLSAASRDPVALKRTLVVLRKRNKALQHLHSTCSGSTVPLEPQARTAS